jgi:hypothetical protein
MVQDASFGQSRGSLFARQAPLVDNTPSQPQSLGFNSSTASLFVGQEGSSLFAPYPARKRGPVRKSQMTAQALQATMIRHLIAQAEAGPKGYDAVQNAATIPPPRPPTELTLREIYAWIDETPGQQHAIGRYQFIPKTLRRLVENLGVPHNSLFSNETQDKLADALLIEAGLHAFQDGEIERHTLMNNMAKIWAGLPTSTGLSYYDGFAGNHATMTWAYFDSQMARIFPSAL